ncbi:ABC transporter ATP-binding protein [Salegentibacter mishustinae]|uniref:ABC transporter ATP-binding protein n=1 Tax=Salegentibacter mishustinae TaxID=270918 RepID=A0A0Q9ZHK7_9FLAO|nr:ATP-binding cassette domain-containing protein [Salegentibacter mishustinae]KRG28612.1 ABC transporter ATP-binding protein [Salegentibacter mishustinae]MDX1426611.1 ATP-binding cassette domain-containing protein [Salegentibacter mishustinae]PNW22544.1 ABC transporter ATP-binding protein [Salegentibacter mishustinae]PZX67787.1 phospholipid/cholesterol/gamma-HCH transport system ATP-binding protein [Salegentibacter mishustinae]GGW77379.1 phosphonate ABC transporter ATP-binding protein [Salege|tara:strand:- start:219 stop:983 length:765 start_codon:yes stop_codon:yes gene_type:complete
MIEVENLHKAFDGEEVLKGIDFKFEKSKTNLIIGQSGSGKSVLLKCMLGLFTPEKGIIKYDGKPYSEFTEDERKDLSKQIGMVFQGGALFDSMTVEENVMFPLKMFTKKQHKENKERVKEVLNRVNLDGNEKKMPSEISGGMQKRVSIARAIVNRPKYLFCDEPNSGLDPKTATVIDNLIQEITHEYDITTIIITHDMNSVLEIGENIAFLKDGVLAWKGDKSQIFKTDDETVTDFVYSSNLFQKVREAQQQGL